MTVERFRHRPDGHDGICARCGGVLSPVHAVLHFGIEVMTVTPETRIQWMRVRDTRLRAGGSFPVLRRGSEVIAELAARGMSSRRPLVIPCHDLPLRSPTARQLVNVLCALSRRLDRGITRAHRWATQPDPRRRRPARAYRPAQIPTPRVPPRVEQEQEARQD